MALALPFEYDQEMIEYQQFSKWTEKTLSHRVVNLTVKRMVELDQTSFTYQ
jgi:hypothetical protein